jgi:hypothetical protein
VLPQPVADLTDEQRRALMARHLDGRVEEVLLAEGFSIGQLAELALNRLVETKPGQGGSRHRGWLQITAAGRQATAE